jgi:uncharacterized membrane protein YeiB
LANNLLRIGARAVCAVIVGIALWPLLRLSLELFPVHSELIHVLRLTLDPRSKLPPSPAYLLFYGGGGLFLAGLLLRAQEARATKRFVDWFAVIGRASLMCYVLQDWLLKLLPAVFRFEDKTSMSFWFAYLGGTLLVLYRLARRWDRARANRFLSVGLPTTYKLLTKGSAIHVHRQ